uniref:Uncharacterized protein n=1 Tax=Lepeophtheirus salmonis TaxID=72036 RepID=A0A0K2TG43_LEPSM
MHVQDNMAFSCDFIIYIIFGA